MENIMSKISTHHLIKHRCDFFTQLKFLIFVHLLFSLLNFFVICRLLIFVDFSDRLVIVYTGFISHHGFILIWFQRCANKHVSVHDNLSDGGYFTTPVVCCGVKWPGLTNRDTRYSGKHRNFTTFYQILQIFTPKKLYYRNSINFTHVARGPVRALIELQDYVIKLQQRAVI